MVFKRIKQSAERRVKESTALGSAMDIDYTEVVRKIVAITP